MSETNIFQTLNVVDVKDKIKTKNGLSYLSWASAWSEVVKRFPNATFEVIPQTMSDGNTRPWHDDGKTGWVEVSVTIKGKTINEMLAIMDFKNKSIPADSITSADANKSIKRCFTKAIALHGLGLYIYEGEDLPEEVSKANDLQDEILEIIKKKCALSAATKDKVGEICKSFEREANPTFTEEEITGNPKNINDNELLEKLKRQLLAVRKI